MSALLTARGALVPSFSGAREPPRRETRTRPIQHDGDNRRTADDDPLVILIEVERADRLANQHDEHRAEHRIDCAPLAAGEARAANDG